MKLFEILNLTNKLKKDKLQISILNNYQFELINNKQKEIAINWYNNLEPKMLQSEIKKYTLLGKNKNEYLLIELKDTIK